MKSMKEEKRWIVAICRPDVCVIEDIWLMRTKLRVMSWGLKLMCWELGHICWRVEIYVLRVETYMLRSWDLCVECWDLCVESLDGEVPVLTASGTYGCVFRSIYILVRPIPLCIFIPWYLFLWRRYREVYLGFTRSHLPSYESDGHYTSSATRY